MTLRVKFRGLLISRGSPMRRYFVVLAAFVIGIAACAVYYESRGPARSPESRGLVEESHAVPVVVQSPNGGETRILVPVRVHDDGSQFVFADSDAPDVWRFEFRGGRYIVWAK